jgi:hypothetical protein
LISNFRRVLYVVYFLLGNSTPTCLWRGNSQSVSKRWRIKFRCRGITRKKTYNMCCIVVSVVTIVSKDCSGFISSLWQSKTQ